MRGLHASVQGCHGNDLPLVDAQLGDVSVGSGVLRRSLLDCSPRVKVENLTEAERAVSIRVKPLSHV